MNLRPTILKLSEYKDKNGKTIELFVEFTSKIHLNDYDIYLRKNNRMIQFGRGVRFSAWKREKIAMVLADHRPLWDFWWNWHN
jgi:hypothetical protein